MHSARFFVDQLAGDGLHYFTAETAMVALGGTRASVMAQLRRLCRSGHVAMPLRGFFIIVPPEYRRLQCLPPDQFVPDLMRHLGLTYYAALLTAAEFHGAAHQRPQAFQVMIAKNRRHIVCGHVSVVFTARHDLAKTPVLEHNTPRGRIRISTPEATALELVAYPEYCGGMNNVASVLNELADSMEAPGLLEAARSSPLAWSQRLGYLLERFGHQELAAVLEPYVSEHAATFAPLVRAMPIKGAQRVVRWKLKVNMEVEAET